MVATPRAHDVPMAFPDGTTRVWVMPVATSDDAAPDVEARIEAAGFAPDSRRSIWIACGSVGAPNSQPKETDKACQHAGSILRLI